MKTLMMEGKQVRLQVWDTAGQERFRTITQSYFKGSQGIILCYDCTNRSSFKNLEHWIKQIEKSAEADVELCLVATKSEVVDKAVTAEEGNEFAKLYGMLFFETSSQTG